MSKQKLSARQRKFIALYEGNATKAAIQAGYSKKTAKSIGQENLTKPDIIKALLEREERETGPLIANRKARQQFWTKIMFDETVEMRDRLKASELLGRSEGDFTERILHDVTGNLAEQIKEARERVRQAEIATKSKRDK